MKHFSASGSARDVACRLPIGYGEGSGDDGGILEPGSLRAQLTRAGEMTGEYDEDEAMVLTGHVVTILSLRRRRNVPSGECLASLVRRVLFLKGHVVAARLYAFIDLFARPGLDGATEGDGDGRNLPPMIYDDTGIVCDFDPGRLRGALTRAGLVTGEMDDNEAMVVTGVVVRLLSRVSAKLVSVEHLRDVVEEVLILGGFVHTAAAFARRTGEVGPLGGCERTLRDAVGTYLRRLESALGVAC